MNITLPRQVHVVTDTEGGQADDAKQPLSAFRAYPAWVLLGEPGAGKTEAMKSEAAATGGHYCRIADFIETDDLNELHGKVLFLDALDEVRSSAGETILLKIRSQLQKLGRPAFRLSCRAADWYGATDREDLAPSSSDGRLVVLQLEPLTETEITTLLHENYGIEDAKAFVQQAGQHGIASLLSNPQTLELLARTVSDTCWPDTRTRTFELACNKLVEESNPRHRARARSSAAGPADLLDAAGYLCAILLLADKTGIALDSEAAHTRFPLLDRFLPPDRNHAAAAIKTRLFIADGENRFVPKHRSIAEYLAARWLARRLDRKQLSLHRLLGLFTGGTGGVVAGLRGLYAWLASASTAARSTLIEIDPVTVIVYGDTRSMPSSAKRHLINGLRNRVGRHSPYFLGNPSAHVLAGLWDDTLSAEYLDILKDPDRSDVAQTMTDVVIDVIGEGQPDQDLLAALKAVLYDDSRWSGLRRGALITWLKFATATETLSVLDDIEAGSLKDPEDDFSGCLLDRLYPEHLTPERVLDHLHAPKSHAYLSFHSTFFEYGVAQKAPSDHLPRLLDGLAHKSPESLGLSSEYGSFKRVLGSLLARALTELGDDVDDQTLYRWLGIGLSHDGMRVGYDAESSRVIAQWLSDRPARYLGVLGQCFKSCERLHDDPAGCVEIQEQRLIQLIPPPSTIGDWHFSQLDACTNEKLAQFHLNRAAGYPDPVSPARTLERLQAWRAAHPDKQDWVDRLLLSEIPQYRSDAAARNQDRKTQAALKKSVRTSHISPHLAKLEAGTAPAALMHEVAGVWVARYVDVPGSTLEQRFDNYTLNGKDVLAAAQRGMRNCPLRSDLPAVEEIVNLWIRRKHYLLALPCLVGMDLRWRDDLDQVSSLGDEILSRMLAFWLTTGTGDTPAWYEWAVRQRARLVADVLVSYAVSSLKARTEYVSGLHALEHDPAYASVAALAAPRILAAFPVRARKSHMAYLAGLLRCCLQLCPQALPALILQKTELKSLDPIQRTYWLGAGTLLAPQQYEKELWKHVGRSQSRADAVAGFFEDSRGSISISRIPEKTLGRLIEKLSSMADFDPLDGYITLRGERGQQVRLFISALAGSPTSEAAEELERLAQLPRLQTMRHRLENARSHQAARRREQQFRFSPMDAITSIICNRAPASAADLMALVLDKIDDIIDNLRLDNDDGFRTFWNAVGLKPKEPRHENLCRDALLTRLRLLLDVHGVSVAPEADHHGDKRADIEIAFSNQYSIPVEIKRDTNPNLWTALRDQLIDQYSKNPCAGGFGLYVVLWFGRGGLPSAPDGGKRPKSPEELADRLKALLPPAERQRIHVRVIDVSWPS